MVDWHYFLINSEKKSMKKEDIKQPEGGTDKKTIEKNLAEINYPASEDITKQSEELEGDLGNADE